MRGKTIKVLQDDKDPIEKSVLAKSIVEISRGVNRLFASGLNERAIVALLQETSGEGKSTIRSSTIRSVLESLKNLEKDFVAKPKGKE